VIGPAAFLALIWPRLRAGRTERAVGLAGAVIALAATPFLPVGVPVILAATAAVAGALLSPRPDSLSDSRQPGAPRLESPRPEVP